MSAPHLDPGVLELQVERYLGGELSREETLAFEQDLASPELGEAFREILLVRELLQSAPPHGVPDGLDERIALAIEAEMAGAARVEDETESAIARQTRIARQGAAWAFRGPAMAFAGARAQATAPAEPRRIGSRTAAVAKATGGFLLRRIGSRILR